MTTIFDSDVVESYFDNFRKYGHLDRAQMIVIPDKKTPPAVYDRCRRLQRQGLFCNCPSLEEQDTFLQKLGNMNRIIPHDSDNRRNVGFLMALAEEIDFVISIDDDNYCLGEADLFSEHAVVCTAEQEWEETDSDSGWLNICQLLEMSQPCRVYPRGFPYRQRSLEGKTTTRIVTGAVRMNAGLWLTDPDIDAMTWLVSPVRVCAMKKPSVILSNRTWSPLNTQNTALHRNVLPSYYFIRMGFQLAGLTIDRYGDIFSGYFAQACLRHFGHRIRVGSPLVDHRRNSHNYLADVTKELACILVLEELTEWLREVKLQGTDYCEAYVSLSHALDAEVEKMRGSIWTETTRAFFHQTAYYMREWVRACQVLSGGT
jgi:hypothetical protein